MKIRRNLYRWGCSITFCFLFLILKEVSVFANEETDPSLMDIAIMQNAYEETMLDDSPIDHKENSAARIINEDTMFSDCDSCERKYDPRQHHRITSVKNQGSYGLCWVYAAIAAAESSLIHQGFGDETLNLSELHAAYFYWKLYEENTNTSFLEFCQMGGDEVDLFQAFQKGMGPVTETLDPSLSISENGIISENTILSDSFCNQQIRRLTALRTATMNADQDSIQTVKNLIQTYGAVTIDFYFNASENYVTYAHKENEDVSYYFPVDIQFTSHTAVIVGWDDDYAVENFQKTPPKSGAWLVKNSYGNGKDLGTGYLWISYYDGSIDGEAVWALDFGTSQTEKSVSGKEEESVTRKNEREKSSEEPSQMENMIESKNTCEIRKESESYQNREVRSKVECPQPTELKAIKKVKKNCILIKWKRGKGTLKGYELQISRKKSFMSRYTVTMRFSKGKCCAKCKINCSTKNYYFRIRTWNQAGIRKKYSKWSKKYKFILV